MAEPSKDDVIKQITEAWKVAQKQLEGLRAAVERTGQMAQLKVQSDFLNRDLDRAYRNLGEAVWSQVKKGKLELPASVSAEEKALRALEDKLSAQKASISDILEEGTQVAGRLRDDRSAKGGGKTVASKGKKR